MLTKPDTLPSGASKSRDLWLDVIEGRRFPLKHGYYCTRQPDDDERMNGITTENARNVEQNFFQATRPWSRSSQPYRFGTSNLIKSLSKHLSRIIDERFVYLITCCCFSITNLFTHQSAPIEIRSRSAA